MAGSDGGGVDAVLVDAAVTDAGLDAAGLDAALAGATTGTTAESATNGRPDGHGRLRHRRVLLKLSGEALAGPSGFGIDPDAVRFVAGKVHDLAALDVQVAVVLGAGNIWRGAHAHSIDRSTADQMGMLATVMNCLALQNALEHLGRTVRVQTAIEMAAVAESYIRRRAIHQMEKGYIVVLGAGTGNPYFTTDTAAALRAMELECDVLIKATKVDGIYSADPAVDPKAVRYDHLSYRQALEAGLRVMDLTAFTLCQENDMPIIVVDLWSPDGITAAVRGESVGTRVDGVDNPALGAAPALPAS